MENHLSWKIGGEAGMGIMSSADMLAKACTRAGLHIFSYSEYPSLIRGGHNMVHVRVEPEHVNSHINMVDMVVALNHETLVKYQDELVPGGVLMYDDPFSKPKSETDITRQDIKLLPVPMTQLAIKNGGRVMRNTVAIGASLALTDFPLEFVNSVIEDVFKKKSEEVIKKNEAALRAGYDYVKQNFKEGFHVTLKPLDNPTPKMLLRGNEAIAMGALKAGLKFYCAYPMTPSSGILHYMAAHEKKFGLVVKQTEDELAAMTMNIGASWTGVRSMCATSGGGFALMTEGLSLAGILEVPLVAACIQRPGPATGLPTRQDQSDLRFLLHAGHGEFPKVIIALGDVDDCFYYTFKAFNLAEKYQVPVVLMSDKYLAESIHSREKFDTTGMVIERGNIIKEGYEGYKRHEFTPNGVSPRALPGTPNAIHRASSDEHDEFGQFCEDEVNRKKMMDKRMRKLDALKLELDPPALFGDSDADLTLIGFGSTKLQIKDTMKILQKEGYRVNYLQIKYINPFQSEEILDLLESSKRTLLVENNFTSQLGGLLKEKCHFIPDQVLLKYDGRPFYPHEIYDKCRKMLEMEVVAHG